MHVKVFQDTKHQNQRFKDQDQRFKDLDLRSGEDFLNLTQRIFPSSTRVYFHLYRGCFIYPPEGYFIHLPELYFTYPPEK